MDDKLSFYWCNSSQINPPKNQWVLMLDEKKGVSTGRWLGDTWYEFFDTESEQVITIPKPKKWALLPRKSLVSQKSQPTPHLLNL
jgi:hypothetical protein